MRRIFIGSSSEALGYARQIADILAAQQNVKPILWTEIFDPGTLTFEAIERVSRQAAGAVLLATPDDDSVIRDVAVKVPRTNVMIEFGYLTAILGRRRIALCKYHGVELATDLNAFTYVPMGDYQGVQGSQHISASAVEKIIRWAQSLPDLAESVPQTAIHHGYSGRWKVKNKLTRWRFNTISAPSYVDFDGFLDLVLPSQRSNGSGCVYGDLNGHIGECFARISFGAQVENAFCDDAGGLNFVSRIHSRQIVLLEGEPPFKEGFGNRFRGPNHAVWALKPSAPAQLRGTFKVVAGDQVSDEAECMLDKLAS
jgi:CAP12/Pycsar effector protein, TIR domain